MNWLIGAGPSRLQLDRILVGAALTLYARRRGLLHALTPPLVLQLVMLAFDLLAPASARAMLLGFALLSIPMYLMMAINVHRLVLLGEAAVPRFGFGPWGMREWRFLGWTWLQSMAASFAFVVLSPLNSIGMVGLAAAIGGAAWVAGRMSMMLPGIAIDRPLDLRSGWRLGQREGLRLVVVAVALPIASMGLLWPLSSITLPPLEIVIAVVANVVTCWLVACTSLVWQQLQPGATAAGPRGIVDGQAAAVAPPPGVDLVPDAGTGVLQVRVHGRFATEALGQLAARDGLAAYHGRLRALVLQLDGADWDPGEHGAPDWTALDTLLSHLALVRVHHEHVLRVALVAPTAWAGRAEDLRKHFGHAEVRFFPPSRLQRATAWASGEQD